MKAVVYREFGGPDSLEITDVPEPRVGPDWVKIAVRAVSVNPVDWKLAGGMLDALLETHFPSIPGWDVAGVVESVGPAVRRLAPGDEVYGYVRKDTIHGGTYAEKVAAPLRTVTLKPKNMDFTQASAVPLAGLTAYQTLIHDLQIAAGETVVIHAAAGGVGSFAVQIAVAQGARVIGTASEKNHDYLRGLGAIPVTYGEGLVERVREIAPDGVDAVLDLIGGDALMDSPALLSAKSKGRLVSVTNPVVKELGGIMGDVHPDVTDLDAITKLVEAGKIKVDVSAVYPLEEVAKAWTENMTGHTRGKIVLTVN
jgi:NADPH:quinone reductase-like Zn-dependent oxidoreductase